MGLLLLAGIILLGRVVRHEVLEGPDGNWRDPLWLEQLLPPLPAATAEPERPRRLSRPLDPNSAPAESLVLLPGVGPVIAGRLLAARRRGVHFARPEDLARVRGIGPVAVQRLAPHLVFADSAAAAAICTLRGAAGGAAAADSISSCNTSRR
jgi:competence protein ComEA